MLKDKLEEMKGAAAAQIPPENLAIMLRSRDALGNTDILEQTIKVGDRVGDFRLADADGTQVDLAELRNKGPVVISIYRGVW